MRVWHPLYIKINTFRAAALDQAAVHQFNSKRII